MKEIEWKVWGKEIIIADEPEYCGKILVLNEGAGSSWHRHPKKETFFCLVGRVRLMTAATDKLIGPTRLSKGVYLSGPLVIMTPVSKPVTILPMLWHQFHGLEDSEIMEVSTHDDPSLVERRTQSYRGKYKVLITGVSGFVGSHLADYLLAHEPETIIHGLKRWRSPLDNVKHLLPSPRVVMHDGDLKDMSSTMAILGKVKPDVIVHLAAQSFVPYSYSVPSETLATNVLGTLTLLEAVRLIELKPRILVVSSPEVYGQPDKAEPMNEDTPLKPLSPYAVSKVAEDMLGFMYHKAYRMDIVRSRAFSHEGPRRGAPFMMSSFARQIALIEKGIQEPVIRVGNLNSVRTYCDVRDTVRAYWLLVKFGYAGEVYNIAGDNRASARNVLDELLKMTPAQNIKVEVDPSLLRPIDVTLQIPDDSKFRKQTGWKPEIPLLKTLADTLQYWRENV